jgi:uncharacterized OB-fold protein
VTAGPGSLGEVDTTLRGYRFEVPTEPLLLLEPEQDPDTDFFWRGPHDDVLRLLTCSQCGYITHPPGPVCGRCHSRDVSPQPVSGRGTLWAWTVSLQPFVPGSLPYCIASTQIVEQDDVRLTSQLVDCAYEQIVAGLAVEVVFVTGAGGARLPFFRPVPG